MKSKRIISAVLCAAVILSAASCGAINGDTAEFTRKTEITEPVQLESEPEPTDTESESDTAETDDSAADSAAVEASADMTSSEDSSSAAEEKPKPTKLKASVLEGHNFYISNFKGKVYSNKKLENALNNIDGICNDYSGIMSFTYLNLDTGAKCEYRSDVKYPTCSTVKAPFVKQLLERGVDLDEKFPINVIWDGDTGKFASKGYGASFTAKQYMKYAVSQSDNTAYYNLVKHYGYSGFNEKNNELGVNYWLGDSWIFTYCTTEDLTRQFKDIYEFAEKNKKGKWLIKLMQDTDVETQITAQLADKYPVAHKYGADAVDQCFHDCAIVYADSPFVLVIMTNQVEYDESSVKVFRKLAKQFDIVNSQLYVKGKQ